MGLLEGKRVLITGVLTEASLAFGVAELIAVELARDDAANAGPDHGGPAQQ